MLEALEWAQKHAGLSEVGFTAEPMRQHATVRMLQVLGDAAKAVSDDVKSQYPEVPWRNMARMRDLLVHHYFSVDLSIVWRTVHGQLPMVHQQLTAMLRES